MKPFELVVYAIVAIVVIIAFFNVLGMLNKPPTLTEDITKALAAAQAPSNTGKTISLGIKEVMDGTEINKKQFNNEWQSVVFVCTSTRECCDNGKICDKPVEWSYENFRFKNQQRIRFYARCLFQQGMPVCRVYVGNAPAQVKVTVKSSQVQQGKAITKIEVTNTGGTTLLPATIKTKLLKYASQEWQDTLMEFAESETKALMPNEKQEILIETLLPSAGKYRINYRVESLDAGFDENSAEVNFLGNDTCVVDEVTPFETVFSGTQGKYYEMHYCKGCNYSFECSAAWETKNQGITYEPVDTEKAYCVKSTEAGNC